MMNYSLLDVSAVSCALAAIYLLRAWSKNRSRLPLPPGPKGYPLIGNIFDMPEAEEWEAARKWGEKYGPLVHVKNFGNSYIFVNSYQAGVDLFEKRGSNYSSRPKNTMWELEGWGWFIPVMPYGDELRRTRQLMYRFFQQAVVMDFADIQTHSTYKMVEGLLSAPDKFVETLTHAAGETILMMSYGYKVEEKNDPFIEMGNKGLDAFSEAEGFFLVNAFPWLQYLPSWFPGAGFHKIASEGYKKSMDALNEPHKLAKEKYLNNNTIPSMSSKLFESHLLDDGTIKDEDLIAKATGSTYAAGADTTISALLTFFLAMLLYPDVQRRAQEELDRVIGKDTLPRFEDRENLPYLNAIIKETYRWKTIAPLATVHTAEEDDEYNGYLIPSGSIVLSNLHAMLLDPVEYPEPDTFIPERWLPKDGKEMPTDVYKIYFGIGRRICPGRHFADNSVFIGAASILASFNITKALDGKGEPITPSGEYTTHFVRHPKPFDYVLTPRSNKIETAIREAVESTK